MHYLAVTKAGFPGLVWCSPTLLVPPLAMPRLLLILVIAIASASSDAQVPTPGTPPSERFAAELPEAADLQAVEAAVDQALIRAFEAEDALASEGGLSVPYRYGVPVDIVISMESAGVWSEVEGGGRVWTARVSSPGASSLSLIFSEYRLPEGAELYIRGESIELGAFTSANNKDHGSLATSVVDGSMAVIEYYVPGDDLGRLAVGRVVHGYKALPWLQSDSGGGYSNGGYGQSASCHVNVNCSAGAPLP